ncbi:hypothetical protein Q9295_11425 [Xinfangfangia sp. CPCC 101601]|uniref:EF-hand domain-containing protein n=1 Tax=Pseudogemmobacter lacusdianii TaxID=3069608 RepID=A0ABU0VZR3_9RHOB|nr:hypothetical protein [Xinfangfangia sp. CPCC 101601]MDQ2066988.1 hypothetical protein [Xinfangfangia sp. CPCC 101601]
MARPRFGQTEARPLMAAIPSLLPAGGFALRTAPGLALVLWAALAAPSVVHAQEATPAPAETTTEPAPAVANTPTENLDCEAEFTRLDTDGNGFVSATEAPRDLARAAVDGTMPAAEGLSRADFVNVCASETWAEMTPEEGAPFEGANSFTEAQAQERATAWNVTGVSALTLDDAGIWRGTGMVDGKPVSVAVDYKGNVVTAAAE